MKTICPRSNGAMKADIAFARLRMRELCSNSAQLTGFNQLVLQLLVPGSGYVPNTAKSYGMPFDSKEDFIEAHLAKSLAHFAKSSDDLAK